MVEGREPPFDTLRVAPSVVEGREPPLDTLGAVSTVEPQGPEPFDHAHGPEPVEGHGRNSQAAWGVKRLVSAVLEEGPQAQTRTPLGFFQRVVKRLVAG